MTKQDIARWNPLLAAVCEHYDVSLDQLRGSNRDAIVQLARCAIAFEMDQQGARVGEMCTVLNKTDATVRVAIEQYERRSAEAGRPLFKMPQPSDATSTADAALLDALRDVGCGDFASRSEYISKTALPERTEALCRVFCSPAKIGLMELAVLLNVPRLDAMKAVAEQEKRAQAASRPETPEPSEEPEEQEEQGATEEQEAQNEAPPEELARSAIWSRIFDHMTDRQRKLYEAGEFSPENLMIHHRAALLHRIANSDDHVPADEIAQIAELLQVELPAANPATATPAITTAKAPHALDTALDRLLKDNGGEKAANGRSAIANMLCELIDELMLSPETLTSGQRSKLYAFAGASMKSTIRRIINNPL